MEAALNRVISIVYELRKDNTEGEVIEKLATDRPLTFIFGKGQLLPKFEENLKGRKTGDNFSFRLNSEDAYGPVQDNAIVDLPLNLFEIDGKLDMNLLKLENSVPMMDREGRRLNGIIKKIGTEIVTMDFNHPMAGENLYFQGEITEIREASEEEIMHGHIHADQNCGSCNVSDCGEGKASDSGCGCGC